MVQNKRISLKDLLVQKVLMIILLPILYQNYIDIRFYPLSYPAGKINFSNNLNFKQNEN